MNRHLTRRPPRPIGDSISFSRAKWLALVSLTIALPIAAVSESPVAQSQESPNSAMPAADSSLSGSSSGSSTRPTLKLGSQGVAVSELQSLLKLLGYYAGTVDGLYQQSTADAVTAFQQVIQLQSDGIAGTETWGRLLPKAPPVQATAPSSVIPSGATLAPVTPAARPTAPAPAASIPTVTPSPAGYTPVAPAVVRPAPSAPASSASSASSAETVLRRGMEGEAVSQLQTKLQAIGLFSGTVDGVFGTETELAVQAAQSNFGLEPDGVVGPATWEALRR